MTKHVGYTIRKEKDGNYSLLNPSGRLLYGVAVNIQTAKRWAEADLAETRALSRIRAQQAASAAHDRE